MLSLIQAHALTYTKENNIQSLHLFSINHVESARDYHSVPEKSESSGPKDVHYPGIMNLFPRSRMSMITGSHSLRRCRESCTESIADRTTNCKRTWTKRSTARAAVSAVARVVERAGQRNLHRGRVWRSTQGSIHRYLQRYLHKAFQ